ncbi:MAG: cytochrome b/b6 domain-containing protein [Alphaproteobacteria bacterium]
MDEGARRDTDKRLKIWDLPVRLFHILLIALVCVQWYTGENMGIATPDLVEIHIWSGCTLLALVLFRITWGFLGSTTAKFTHFVKGPVTILRYTGTLFSKSKPWVGHNPLGGLSVVLMLGFFLAIPVTGLFSADDEIPGFGPSGPLSHMVSDDTSFELASLHHDLWDVAFILILIHIAAVLFYTVYKGHFIIAAMISGESEEAPAETLTFRPVWMALLVLAVTSGAVALAVTQL